MLLAPPLKKQARYSVPRTRIPGDRWEEVVQRYTNGESLRLLAKLYGISHEAVRQVLKKESDYRS